MNRRHFLAGSMALVAPQKLLHSVGALSINGFAASPRREGQDTQSLTQPHDLLSTTYPQSFLQSKLVSVNEWHPFPKWGERAAWEAIPNDIRAASMERAEAAQKEGWKVLLATRFLEFKRDGNRSHYESDRSGRRAKLASLVLGECMEGKGRFVDDIVDGVWLICEESFWGVPAHLSMQKAGVGLPDITEPIIALFAAETAQLLSWTKYLVGDQLDQVSPLVNKRIVLETERRILGPARDRNDFSWMGLRSDEQDRVRDKNQGMSSAPQIGGVWRIGARLNNWNPWINSNLLVTNLILEEDPQLRLNEMARITRSLDAYLNEYFPDAGEEEGPGYYSRSVLGFFECVSTFESATGNSTNILANPFIDAMGRYILNAHICENNYIDYGDAHVHASPDGNLLYRFGKAVHDEQLEAFGAWCAARQGMTATQVSGNRGGGGRGETSLSRPLAEILGADEIRKARQEDVLLRDCYYPDLGLVTARVKAGSADGMYFADLAANNGRSHSHNDTGSYIIYQDCQPVAIDVGVEAYTAKTFSADRYTIWTMQSAYHNLPTIGSIMQHDGAEFKATDRKFSSDNERATYSFNIASAYPKEAGVKSWVRTITLDRSQDRVTVQEDFELERAVPVSLSVMTPRIATVNSGSINMKLANGTGMPCVLKYDPAALEPKVETMPLTDPGLRESWGNQVYRILFNSKQPVASGKWTYEFSA
jgi:Heparinase II/III-like protein